MTTENNDFDFNWDDPTPQETEETTVEETVEASEDKEASEESNEESEVNKETEEVDEDLFDWQGDTPSDDKNSEESEDVEESEDGEFISLLKKGDYLPEDFEVNEVNSENFEEVIEAAVTKRNQEILNSFFQELPSDGVNLLKHLKEGGSFEDWTSNRSLTSPEYNPENTKDQEKIVASYLKLNGEDDSEIEDRIAYLKDKDKLKDFATKYNSKLEDSRKANEATLEKQRQDKIKAQEDQNRAFQENVNLAIDKNEKVGHFTLTNKEKKELPSYMTKASHKVSANNYITPFQKDLSEAFRDPQKSVVLAKILKSNFKVDDLIRSTQTKTTRKAKKSIKGKSSSNNHGSSLLDFL